MKKACSVLLALSAFGTSAAADTILVPGDFPTIQGTIQASVDGDEIVVRPGTYVENLVIISKSITVRSEHEWTDQLAKADRDRIAQTDQFMTIFTPVSFDQYQAKIAD